MQQLTVSLEVHEVDQKSINRLMGMEAKLRVINEESIEKLVLPLGIPNTVEELKIVVKQTFGFSEDFSLQYLDADFGDYFSLHTSDQIKDKDTIKVVRNFSVTLNILPVGESLDSSFIEQSADCESAVESLTSNADSVGTSSSQDTIILPRQSGGARCQPWPKEFPIPQFAYETEMSLETACEDYKKNGTLLNTLKVKSDILEKLAETVYKYTAYPSSLQISEVADALVRKFPCLKEPGSFSGYYGWQQSLKYKMANYRTKLRNYGVPEVTCNALKSKRSVDQKSAKNIKKPRKAEINYLPPYPAGEDEEVQEEVRIQLLSEVTKRDNSKIVKEKMAKTFAHRRNEIINLSPSIEQVKARWPALFEASQVEEEFYRITMVHLEAKFMGMLDEYTAKLMSLFHSKGGAMGLKLQAILLKDNDEDSVSKDLAEQNLKIYHIKLNSAAEEFGIVIEGVQVLTALGNFARACAMFVGLTYVLNLAYPKEVRYTFEMFQKIFLELDCTKLSPKLISLKNKLLV